MANKFKGQAELTFTTDDGKVTRKLQFDANAFCEIEEASGLNLGEMLEALSDPKRMSMRTVRAIVYGGLQTHHPSPSLQEGLVAAGNVISEAGLETTLDAIKKATVGAMGKPKPGSAPAKTG